eukprot:TRINITY_DN1751_c0_g1_i1.p1 TRINITY_DN1751_c0_g1~~TRINITY_DN1751_c0_g1_i1.p1  ORF type:complete len:225 (+),score=49.32 TRINITY_DN1751_c0_g1_i1:501-1175(+)
MKSHHNLPNIPTDKDQDALTHKTVSTKITMNSHQNTPISTAGNKTHKAPTIKTSVIYTAPKSSLISTHTSTTDTSAYQSLEPSFSSPPVHSQYIPTHTPFIASSIQLTTQPPTQSIHLPSSSDTSVVQPSIVLPKVTGVQSSSNWMPSAPSSFEIEAIPPIDVVNSSYLAQWEENLEESLDDLHGLDKDGEIFNVTDEEFENNYKVHPVIRLSDNWACDIIDPS